MLVGGGHAHVCVVREFGRAPLPDVRVTLVSRDSLTPYSGMLPGVVGGWNTAGDAHIDLARLAQACGARLALAEAVGLDRASRRLLLRDGSTLPYDLLSIDVGITPALDAIGGAARNAIAVKPIGAFVSKLEAVLRRVREGLGPASIAMVGGGAAGVEIILALQARLRAENQAGAGGEAVFSLVTASELLAGHNARVRAAFRRILAERGVRVFEGRRVRAISPGAVECVDGAAVPAELTLVSTHAHAPGWLAETGLATDPGGFLRVGLCLQTETDPDIFAAGDCASLVETPREKAGVYAVRAGPPLAANLRRRALGQRLRPWTPQSRHLSLITAGENYAIASRGAFKAEGEWVWRLKNWIDRRWMEQYRF